MARDEASSSGSGESVNGTSYVINTGQNMKIDVIKFDGTINFGMWRSEGMDALLAQGLENTIELDTRPEGVVEKDWVRKNHVACAVIKSCLTQDIKYHVMTEVSVKKI